MHDEHEVEEVHSIKEVRKAFKASTFKKHTCLLAATLSQAPYGGFDPAWSAIQRAQAHENLHPCESDSIYSTFAMVVECNNRRA